MHKSITPAKRANALTKSVASGMVRQMVQAITHQSKENAMPVITIDTATLTREKKEQLVATLTRNASDITGIAPEKFIVLINELERDNIGVGGQLLSDILK